MSSNKEPKKVEEFQFPVQESKGFVNFLYDPKERTFMGRGAKNWSQLLLFYAVFYAVLAAMFAICMKGLLSTLNDVAPKYQLESSLIGTNPGLGYRPMSENETERGAIIQFSSRKEEEKQFWVKLLDEFLEPYTNRTQSSDGGINQKVCGFGDSAPDSGKACAIDMDKFGECSPKNKYGYAKSHPCIFVKLNKIFNWVPDVYEDINELPDDMPEDLKNYIISLKVEERKQVWISCKGQFGNDKQAMHNITYYPQRGFPAYYYPYKNQDGYLSPLVAVQIRPPVSQLLNIECRAWAKNIIYNGSIRDRMGSIAFQILMD